MTGEANSYHRLPDWPVFTCVGRPVTESRNEVNVEALAGGVGHGNRLPGAGLATSPVPDLPTDIART